MTCLPASPDNSEREGSVDGDEGRVRRGDEFIGCAGGASELADVGDIGGDELGYADRLTGHTAFTRREEVV